METFTINITELEKKILEEHLLDVQAWIEAAVEGKINQCRKRTVASHTQTLINDPEVENIPATSDGICENLFNSAGYQNRAERDASASS